MLISASRVPAKSSQKRAGRRVSCVSRTCSAVGGSHCRKGRLVLGARAEICHVCESFSDLSEIRVDAPQNHASQDRIANRTWRDGGCFDKRCQGKNDVARWGTEVSRTADVFPNAAPHRLLVNRLTG